MAKPQNVLAIYTDQDKNLVNSILHPLKPLEKDANVTIWRDDPIYANQQWKLQDTSRLNQADFVLFLTSNAFMYSTFVQQIEFKNVIDKYKAGEVQVIPILLDECPWDTEFNSDDYDFSFAELQVLPDNREPISDWDSSDEAIKHVADQLRMIIAPASKKVSSDKAVENVEGHLFDTKKEEQIALSFYEEVAPEPTPNTEAKTPEAVESQKQEQLAEEKNKREAAEAAKEKAILDEKRKQEALAAKRAALEKEKLETDAKAKRQALEEQKLREAAEAKREVQHETWEREKVSQAESDVELEEHIESHENQKNDKLKNRALIAIFATIVIFGIWFFSDDNKSPEKLETTSSEVEVTAEKNSEPTAAPKKEESAQEVPSSKLAIGDFYKGGIIFSADENGKTGKIASIDDAGPMSWIKANKIHEQMGEGWRLPTLDELRTMYKTIGQGATNKGEFSDGLYWSATIYETYQARLLRFRDGNASYHYNKGIENRKFLVRAVRDF